ncbi:ABC transporter substrate-binding protein [Calidifontimicrobium sp. SYSU G02091]|uniref:ABC transporter substrate-binding protein n=1 Tax=Calidifontimicrobium sp. SYSU G02091 TaxID=2926421 RepID=UPI001F537314|nr:ABC transporter substrate-binding protein [Calidifontimicrobium sp. SYSU G02091]MCI1191218.1 ABC transporter substrate-binding protein [Calidifontimicrobium sp. SYSU G02091]
MHTFQRTLLALTLAGVAGFAAAGGVTDTEIVVGSHLDLSGPTAAGMPMLRNAMQMRIDEVNAAGGVHGRRIRLVVEDNGSQPQQAVRAVQKLIKSDDVFAILNAFGSGPNAATVKAATDAGVVVFAPWAASAIVQRAGGGSPLVFTTVQNYDTTTATGLSWAIKNWGVKKVGVIYQEGPFGDLVRAGVAEAMKAANMTVAAEAAYKVGDIDFSSQVARMKAADVDLILAGTVVRETVGVMAEVKKLGWDVKVLTTLPGRSSIVARLGKDAVEGLYGLGGWQIHDASTKDPGAQKFIAAYKAKFNTDPDENAANAYSYTDWFIKCLQAAGRNLSAQSFAAGCQGVSHEDFTTYSKQSFVKNHVNPEYVAIDVVKGGRWVPVAPAMASAAR